MPVAIKSKREGFRRCGVAHPKPWTEYPDGMFTLEELEILEAEPMLDVIFKEPEPEPEPDPPTDPEITPEEKPEPGPESLLEEKPEPETVAQLKEALDTMGVKYVANAKKVDLEALYAQAAADIIKGK